MRPVTALTAILMIIAASMTLGCTRAPSAKAKFNLSWDSNSSFSVVDPRIRMDMFESWGGVAPNTVAGFDCLAVVVDAGKNLNTCTNPGDSSSFNFDYAAGFVAPNGNLEIVVPPGNVNVRVIGTKSLSGSCPDFKNLDRLSITEPRTLAVANVTLKTGENTVEVTLNPALSTIGKCVGGLAPSKSQTCNIVAKAGSGFASDTAIVHLSDGYVRNDIEANHGDLGLTFDFEYAGLNSHVYEFNVTPVTAAKLCSDPAVQYVEPVDPIDGASFYGGSLPVPVGSNPEPIVAIISSGISYDHHVFVDSDALWTNPSEVPANSLDDDGNGFIDDIHGWNFYDDNEDIADLEGDGTHVAGIALDQNIDITANPIDPADIKLAAIKILDPSGSTTSTQIAKAILYAASIPADVIVIPLGGTGDMETVRRAMRVASNAGILIVTAAGNTATDNDLSPIFPASFNIVNNLSVGAHATSDPYNLTAFSNFGFESVHLTTFGVSQFTTSLGDTYVNVSGTTMAAGVAGGVAAMMKTYAPSLTGYQLKDTLLTTAEARASHAGKFKSGGRLDRASAWSAAAAQSGSTPNQPQQ